MVRSYALKMVQLISQIIMWFRRELAPHSLSLWPKSYSNWEWNGYRYSEKQPVLGCRHPNTITGELYKFSASKIITGSKIHCPSYVCRYYYMHSVSCISVSVLQQSNRKNGSHAMSVAMQYNRFIMTAHLQCKILIRITDNNSIPKWKLSSLLWWHPHQQSTLYTYTPNVFGWSHIIMSHIFLILYLCARSSRFQFLHSTSTFDLFFFPVASVNRFTTISTLQTTAMMTTTQRGWRWFFVWILFLCLFIWLTVLRGLH